MYWNCFVYCFVYPGCIILIYNLNNDCTVVAVFHHASIVYNWLNLVLCVLCGLIYSAVFLCSVTLSYAWTFMWLHGLFCFAALGIGQTMLHYSVRVCDEAYCPVIQRTPLLPIHIIRAIYKNSHLYIYYELNFTSSLYIQVQKTFCEKMGRSRVGRACALKQHKVRKQDCGLVHGVVSSHAPTSWGWGSIFAIFTSWVQHYFSLPFFSYARRSIF